MILLLNPKEDLVSVKDSVTFGLPAHGPLEGMEAGGSSGHPATPPFKFTWGHAAKDESTDDVGKRHSCHQKKKKGGVNGSNADVGMEVERLPVPC